MALCARRVGTEKNCGFVVALLEVSLVVGAMIIQGDVRDADGY